MAILSKSIIATFADGDQVTSTKLNNLVDTATFRTGAGEAVDGTTLLVDAGGYLKVGTVQTGNIASSAVTTAKIADSTGAADGVTTAKLATSAVSTAKLADLAVTTAKIADSGVTTAKIADANVTAAKLSGAQSGSAPVFGARAFVVFDATRNAAGTSNTDNTTRYIYASGNVTSVTKTATGVFTVLMTTALDDSNYAVTTSVLIDGIGPRLSGTAATNNTTTTFQVEVENLSDNKSNAETISAVVFK